MKYLTCLLLIKLFSCTHRQEIPLITEAEVTSGLLKNKITELCVFSAKVKVPCTNSIPVTKDKDCCLLSFASISVKERFIKRLFKEFPSAGIISGDQKYLQKFK